MTTLITGGGGFIATRLAARDSGYVPEHDTPAKLVDAFVREAARELAAR